MDEEVKETLKKQLQLLSERSQDKNLSAGELAQLTEAMAMLYSRLACSKL